MCALWRAWRGGSASPRSWLEIPSTFPANRVPQAEKTQAFATELGELTGLPIHLWDERLTTREAHQILYEAGHPRQDHRRVVDQVAATLILQSFLDNRESGIRKQGSMNRRPV